LEYELDPKIDQGNCGRLIEFVNIVKGALFSAIGKDDGDDE